MQQLSAQDASFVYLESAATPMHVGSLCLYDGSSADPERLVEEAILRNVDNRLHLNATTRRRVVRVPFEADYPYWIEDGNFDLEYHVRRIALPKPGDRETLMKLAARIFSRPLDMSKPLWELYVIEGLDNVEGVPADSFAVLSKTHHAAVDGASGLHFLEMLHDLGPQATKIPPAKDPWRPDPMPTDAELMFRTSINNLRQPFRFAEMLSRQFSQQAKQSGFKTGNPFAGNTSRAMSTPQRIPKTRFNGTVTPHRVMGSVDLSLDDVRIIRKAVDGATVNDAVLAICGGALRTYLESKNELDEDSLIAMAPVNVRSADESTATGGNRVSALFIPIGTQIADPLARLQYIHNETSASKLMHSAVGAAEMTDYGKFVPAFTAALASRLITETAANAPNPPYNVSITNVPGPQEPLYFSSAPMVAAMGIGPITQGMGLIFPVLSYCGRITVSFTSCREILPDPDYFESCIQTSFDTLLSASQGKT
jgi:diacylglycerol O-acyltransferase / wax synthase